MLLRNSVIQAEISREKGGKLTSLIHLPTGEELLAQPAAGRAVMPWPGMPFEQGEAAGMDDVFPSMGEAARPGCWPEISDHGLIWFSAMETKAMDGGISLQLFSAPWRYRKELRLQNSTIEMRWRIRNEGALPASFVWIFHGLWRLEEDMSFFFPAGTAVDVLNPAEPEVPLVTQPIAPGYMRKIYLREPVQEGKCGFAWPSKGLRVTLRFDAKALPYLGFWMTNGGWRGDRNFAFEPATSYYDTMNRASQSGTLVTLASGEEVSFWLKIDLEWMEKEGGHRA